MIKLKNNDIMLMKVSEDGTGSRSPSKDVGDVGVPPHLNFLNKNGVRDGIIFIGVPCMAYI